jgi:glycosyltransferase involved in cell wall biosynthesis
MQILQVITDTDRRGAQVFAMDLEEELATRGWQVETVALALGDSDHPLPVRVLGKKRLSLRTLLSLRRAARGAQIVVGHGSATLQACAVALYSSGVPFVYRNIGDPVYWARSRSRRLRKRAMLSRAHAVVAVWPGAARALHDVFRVPHTKVRVIPKACPAARFPPVQHSERMSSRRRLGLPDGAPTAVYVGALSPEKNVEIAIRAIGALSPAVLVLAGDGPDRHRLEFIARSIAPHRAIFLGVTDRPHEVLAAADVLVLPSKTEGVPGALIEAGLRGLPVVATRVGGVPSMLEGSSMAVLVPPDDQGALTEALRVLLSQELPRVRARADWTNRFEIGPVGESWDHFLAECGARIPSYLFQSKT